MMQPALFLSHGSPMLALTPTPARAFLEGLAASLPPPRAILVASAHWETASPTLNAVEVNRTIHDFRGFPDALYRLVYHPPGDPALARHAAEILDRAGLTARIDAARGLDHGAWVPLLLAYPEAKIPVLQISVQTGRGPAHHLALGRALCALRREDVLIIGSGSFTHDLRRFRGQPVEAPEQADVAAFAAWMDARIEAADLDALLDYRARAPHAADQHPTEEHLLPLFVALGAAGPYPKARRLHRSVEHAILRMDAYAFDSAD
jgi:4,5-DOPA dioxygenase extradiol